MNYDSQQAPRPRLSVSDWGGRSRLPGGRLQLASVRGRGGRRWRWVKVQGVLDLAGVISSLSTLPRHIGNQDGE